MLTETTCLRRTLPAPPPPEQAPYKVVYPTRGAPRHPACRQRAWAPVGSTGRAQSPTHCSPSPAPRPTPTVWPHLGGGVVQPADGGDLRQPGAHGQGCARLGTVAPSSRGTVRQRRSHITLSLLRSRHKHAGAVRQLRPDCGPRHWCAPRSHRLWRHVARSAKADHRWRAPRSQATCCCGTRRPAA